MVEQIFLITDNYVIEKALHKEIIERWGACDILIMDLNDVLNGTDDEVFLALCECIVLIFDVSNPLALYNVGRYIERSAVLRSAGGVYIYHSGHIMNVFEEECNDHSNSENI